VHVLLTNDDGIDAPWLGVLAAGLRDAGHDTTVLAPSSDQSGVSGALKPLPMGGEVDLALRAAPAVAVDRAWAVEGATPTICVLLGLGGAVDEPVDVVVSGPNFGWNIGRDVWRSGTAWAAITAWGMGVPALAVSGAPEAYEPDDLAALVGHTVETAEKLTSQPEAEVWNLNVPAPPAASWQPAAWTSLSPGERMTASQISVVERNGDGSATVRLGLHRGMIVPPAAGSDAERVYAGGVALSRLRPLDSWH